MYEQLLNTSGLKDQDRAEVRDEWYYAATGQWSSRKLTTSALLKDKKFQRFLTMGTRTWYSFLKEEDQGLIRELFGDNEAMKSPAELLQLRKGLHSLAGAFKDLRDQSKAMRAGGYQFQRPFERVIEAAAPNSEKFADFDKLRLSHKPLLPFVNRQDDAIVSTLSEFLRSTLSHFLRAAAKQNDTSNDEVVADHSLRDALTTLAPATDRLVSKSTEEQDSIPDDTFTESRNKGYKKLRGLLRAINRFRLPSKDQPADW